MKIRLILLFSISFYMVFMNCGKENKALGPDTTEVTTLPVFSYTNFIFVPSGTFEQKDINSNSFTHNINAFEIGAYESFVKQEVALIDKLQAEHTIQLLIEAIILAKIITVNVRTNQTSTLWLSPSIIIPKTKTATPDKNATRPDKVRCNCSLSSRAFSFQTKLAKRTKTTTAAKINIITIGPGINQLNGFKRPPISITRIKAAIISLANVL